MRPARILLVLVLGVAAFAACGDDGGSDDSSGSGTGTSPGTEQSFCEVADAIYNPSQPQPQEEADAEDVVDLFRRLEDAAPSEIAAEATILREFIAVQFGVEEPSDDPPDQATIAEAENTVRDYLREECGIVPPAPTTTAAA